METATVVARLETAAEQQTVSVAHGNCRRFDLLCWRCSQTCASLPHSPHSRHCHTCLICRSAMLPHSCCCAEPCSFQAQARRCAAVLVHQPRWSVGGLPRLAYRLSRDQVRSRVWECTHLNARSGKIWAPALRCLACKQPGSLSSNNAETKCVWDARCTTSAVGLAFTCASPCSGAKWTLTKWIHAKPFRPHELLDAIRLGGVWAERVRGGAAHLAVRAGKPYTHWQTGPTPCVRGYSNMTPPHALAGTACGRLTTTPSTARTAAGSAPSLCSSGNARQTG